MRPSLITALSTGATTVLLLPLMPGAAWATPVANDVAASATTISTLPSTVTQDTTGATTDDLDAALNAECGAPFTNASVWFRYTDPDGGAVMVDTSASSYSAGVMVTQGDPSAGNLVGCGPQSVAFETTPAQTYYIVAFSDTEQVGGQLKIVFDEAKPAHARIAIDPTVSARKDGTARVTGTYACSGAHGADSTVDGTLTQRVGRFKITGVFSFAPLVCDGAQHRWSATAVSDTGLFRGGKGTVAATITACGALDCASTEAKRPVRLTPARNR